VNPTLVRKVIYPTYRALKRDEVLRFGAEMRRVASLQPKEIQQYQWQKAQRLIAYAAKHVPYYRRAFQGLGVRVEDLRGLGDIVRLPVLRKRDIRENLGDLVSEVYPKRHLRYDRTSGATGESLYFYYDRASSEARRANYVEMNRWAGIEIGDRVAYLWGRQFDVPRYRRLINSLRSRISNNLMLSMYAMDPESLNRYAKMLAEFKPRAIVGYPSALTHFAQAAAASRRQVFQPSAIVVSGETLYDWQRETIEKAFGAKVHNHYGCCEFGAMARECRAHNGLHIASDRILVEVVPVERSAAGEEISELVITDLDNYGAPFIRYAIEDLGTITWDACECGLRLPRLRNAIGRTFDVIRAPNHNFLGGTFWTILLKTAKGVERFQVVQDKIDSITMVIVPTPEFSDESRAFIVGKVREACGPEMQVHFDLRNSLEPTAGGKHRFVISRIGLKDD
jgi:phenylacetate-CoA ligase